MACYPGQPSLQQSGEDFREKNYEIHHPDQSGSFEGDLVALKSHTTRAIVKWLESTYQYEEGICLPRSTIYEHYTDFCNRGGLQPVNAASFGKIIRQQFPTLTTRRLGTRGQSKYHYYGLGIMPTSIYYTEEYLQRQNQGVIKKEPETKKTHAYYASKEKPSAVLPKFPDVKNVSNSDNLSSDKLHTFMVMYRAHCQRILDSVVRANFDEVENFLLHFWQGMPSHLVPVLSSDLVVDLVAVCDMILYRAVISVFITTPLQNIPDNVAQEVRAFSNNLKCWLETALKGLPECLTEIKFKAAEMFNKSFKRQRSLMHLADAARNAFNGEESLEQLESDWAGLNLHAVFAQTLYTIQPLNIPRTYLDMVPNFLAEFSCMFSDEKCSVEDFALWIEGVMDSCLKDLKKGSIRTAGRAFLLTWKFFTSKVVREFTLMSAPSFGTFHLLHMLVDDYIMHSLESMLEKELEEHHLERINLLKQEDIIEDIRVEDRLSSNISTNIHAHPSPLTSPTQEYLQYVPQNSSDFEHPLSARNHTSPPSTAGIIGVGGSKGVIISVMESEARKNDFPTESVPRSFQTQDTDLLSGDRMQLNPTSLQGLGHGTEIASESSSGRSESFRNILHSQESNSLVPPDPVLGLRSLSHPSLVSNISTRTLPTLTQSSSNIPTQSQAPISFPAHLGSFALSSMVGHFTSHPQLQSQSLSMNPTGGGGGGGGGGGLMQGLGVSVSSNQPQLPISGSLAHGLSLCSTPVSGLLASGSNSSLPIVNAPVSLSTGGGSLGQNSLPMPLTHQIAGNLQNPPGLPLLSGMPGMYSYPYTTTLPTAIHTSSVVYPNAPAAGFPSQSIMPAGYPQYISPSLYGNLAQPPSSTHQGNFSR